MSEPPPRTARNRPGRPLAWATVLALGLVLVTALWAFQPWRLFTTRETDERPPSAAATAPSPAPGTSSSPDRQAPPEPVVLSEGVFVSQEHETSGTARVIELPDGGWIVRLEDLSSSDGPDLHVLLTDQEAGGDWFKYRDGRSVDLGELRGTHGDANYEIPADADIDGATSVVIWCERFSVAFGSAPVSL